MSKPKKLDTSILAQIRKRESDVAQASYVPEESVFCPQPVVYIFGGGPSLVDFDINLLRHKFVIGCNDAYTLGSDLVNMVAFGDWKWWETNKVDVCARYDGPIISTNGRSRMEPRTRWIKRFPEGLHRENGCGWNYSTGAMAVNLALRLGARDVVLLGIDMSRPWDGDGPPPQNWHPNPLSNPPSSTYLRYIGGFRAIKQDLPKVFPQARIINANIQSKLDIFPKMPREEAFKWF